MSQTRKASRKRLLFSVLHTRHSVPQSRADLELALFATVRLEQMFISALSFHAHMLLASSIYMQSSPSLSRHVFIVLYVHLHATE